MGHCVKARFYMNVVGYKDKEAYELLQAGVEVLYERSGI